MDSEPSWPINEFLPPDHSGEVPPIRLFPLLN